MPDIISVLRIVEYVGERKAVEDAVERSIHGTRRFTTYKINAATLGVVADLLTSTEDNKS